MRNGARRGIVEGEPAREKVDRLRGKCKVEPASSSSACGLYIEVANSVLYQVRHSTGTPQLKRSTSHF